MSSLPHPDDTIAALASAPGGGERGIVRISGPAVVNLLRDWFVSADGYSIDETDAPARRHWCERKVAFRTSGTMAIAGFAHSVSIDLHLWPNRRSYTGQPLAELHAPGSPPLLEAILENLHARGARPAQPGEFTLRAFLAGRIDLIQAEAVLGVIDARDQRELAQALDQMGGGISSQVVRLRGDLLDLLADLEAGLDFSDEEIEFVSTAVLVGRIGLAHEALLDLRGRAEGRMQSATRPRVVLAGPPNAGKSTLFNALVGADRAIVSDERGTTRDYLSAEVAVGGVEIVLVDTAGNEVPRDRVADAAQSFRHEQLARADLRILCLPADEQSPDMQLSRFVESAGRQTLVVRTKSDLCRSTPLPVSPPQLVVSAQNGEGLGTLAGAIAERLTDSTREAGTLLGTTAARCGECLTGAGMALERARSLAREESDQELLAIELREALEELGKIVGAVYTDDILDRIFSKFCIGK
jgi:tRNA modification GTPase